MSKLTAGVEFVGDYARLQRETLSNVKRISTQASRETGKLAASQTHASRTTSALDRGTSSLSGSLKNAVKYATGAALAYVSIAKAEKAVDTTLELSKTTAGLNRNLGLAVNVGSRWGAVAQARDIDAKSLTMSFTILSKRFVEAAHKGGTTEKAFNRLGISQEEIERGSKNFQYALMATAKAFGDTEGGAKRQVSAQELLGRGYSTILPLFAEGTKGLKEQLEWADKFGATLDGKTNDSLMEMVQLQRESKVATLGLQVAFTKAMLPALVEVEKQYDDMVALFARDDLTDSQKWEILGQKIEHVGDEALEKFTDILPEISSQAGKWAPKIAASFGEGFLQADIWGKLAIGFFLAPKLIRGKAMMQSVGTSLGMSMGTGIAAGTEASTVATQGKWKAAFGGLMGIAKRSAYAIGAIGIMGGIAEGAKSAQAQADTGRVIEDGLRGFYRQVTFGAFDFGETWSEEVQSGFVRAMEGFNVPNRGISSKVINDLVVSEHDAIKGAPTGMRQDVKRFTLESAQETIDSLKPTADQWNSWSDSMKKEWARAFNASKSEILNLEARHGIQVPINIRAPQKGEVFKTIGDGLTFLKRGIGTNMADINRVTSRNMRLIKQTIGINTAAGRKLAAENMRATAHAIKKEMERSGDYTQDGMKRVKNLIRNADLMSPTRQQAKSFGDEWAKGMDRSKEVTKEGMNHMIAEAGKMPDQMRDIALRSWLDNIKEAKRGGDITVGEFRKMRSRVLSEYGNISKGTKTQGDQMSNNWITNIGRMVNTTGEALGVFTDNVNQALKTFGQDGKTIQFAAKIFGKGKVNRQEGGIVPGSGEGDHFHTFGQVGAFVMNREATHAFGFQDGGIVPLALEAGERYFSPKEVGRYGRRNLETMNAKVPRFGYQAGGGVGGSGREPMILGPDPLRSLGQAAMHMVYEGGQDYLRKNMGPRPGLGQMDGHSVSAWIIPILEWARAHGWAGTVTSGYRTPAEQMAAAIGYGLEHYGPGGPLGSNHTKINWPGGAVDVSLAAQLASILAGYPGDPTLKWGQPVIGDYVHFSATGHQLGGLITMAGGGLVDGDYTVKGTAASASQKAVEEKILAAADTAAANHLARVAITMAAIQESELGKASPNIFQLTGSNFGMDPNDVTATALYWLRKGYTGQGGGIALSGTMSNPGDIAQAVEGSAHPDAYDPWRSEARRFVDAWGGGSGSSGSLPASKTGSYGPKAGTTSKGGGTAGPRGHYNVQTEKLSFVSLPTELKACTKELELRRKQLGEYRAAARQTKNPKERAAYEANARALETRVSQLRRQRTLLLRKEAAKKRVKTINEAAEFIHWTKPNVGAFATSEHAYDLAQELAQQAVELEPQEPRSGPTEAWIQNVLGPYVEGHERPAYAAVLGAEADWRNTILGAEVFAGDRLGDWRKQIESLQSNIREIEALRHGSKAEQAAYQKRKGVIPGMRQQMVALRKAIVNTRTVTLPEWEDALGGVQGLNRTHSILPALPGDATGEFGGNIFATQLTIRDLDLKIPEALANLSGDSSSDSERTQLLEDLLRQERQWRILRDIESHVMGTMPMGGLQGGGMVKVMPPYAGKAHTGTIVPGPPGQESTMVVRGEEVIRTPERESELSRMIEDLTGSPAGLVIEELNIDSSGHVTGRINGEEFEAEVQKINNKETRRRARRASRGLATPGVFG